jgi:hypothetical protein
VDLRQNLNFKDLSMQSISGMVEDFNLMRAFKVEWLRVDVVALRQWN